MLLLAPMTEVVTAPRQREASNARRLEFFLEILVKVERQLRQRFSLGKRAVLPQSVDLAKEPLVVRVGFPVTAVKQ